MQTQAGRVSPDLFLICVNAAAEPWVKHARAVRNSLSMALNG